MNMSEMAKAIQVLESKGYTINRKDKLVPGQTVHVGNIEERVHYGQQGAYVNEQYNPPKRKSMVETGRQAPRKSQFVERMQSYDLAQLADPTTPIDERLLPQMLQDFGLMMLYKDFLGEV